MTIHKGEKNGTRGDRAPHLLRSPALLAAFAVPLLCLAAYAARLPLPIPRFLAPSAKYHEPGSTMSAILRDSSDRFGTVRVLSDAPPSLEDVIAAKDHYASTGMPVSLERSGQRLTSQTIAAYSLRISGDGSPSALTLLLDAASATGSVLARVDGRTAFAADAAPIDRRVRLPIAGYGSETVVTVEAGGATPDSGLTVISPDFGEPRILMASDRQDARSVIEALFPVRKIPYDELLQVGLYGYELLVLDGPVLARLDGGAAAAIAEYVGRGAGSLLVVVDSSDIGKPGDCPSIEELLPVELSPRSLSRLPDVAMAVAIDVSGSMYGDKLSLAKAVGLELVGNLKPSDVAGLVLFDEEARWLYPPAPVSDLDARRSLAPLRAGGGTRLYPALVECIAALEASDLPEKRIVIVSDGITAPADFDALAARAFRSGIAISAMAVGAEYDKALLTRIAAGSGGRFYRVKDATEVPSLIIEDRKSVSRTIFAAEKTGVVDIAGEAAGSVYGMARLGPKPDAVAFFSSEAGDPLFATRREGTRSTLVFASDVYGNYDKEFLERPGTLSVIAAVLGGLFSERPPSATVTETADGLSLSIDADYLLSPRVALADSGGRIVFESRFIEVGPGMFHAALGRPRPGRYTALVEDRGRTIARFPLYMNGTAGAAPSDSAAAAQAYRTPFWILPRGGAPWLVAFFTLSLCITLMLRLKR
ncbi:MAG: hypothetical protein CVV47_15465 [Spirochaetae bacterium HGW-Spirochaetae-3]|jgi:hypothetical protein|nr:MAG: hypothetical protein CVV47_15465 [Spirochaetae bacterium HGW-Spirochaetae-3]